jgi:hypothetical protein
MVMHAYNQAFSRRIFAPKDIRVQCRNAVDFLPRHVKFSVDNSCAWNILIFQQGENPPAITAGAIHKATGRHGIAQIFRGPAPQKFRQLGFEGSKNFIHEQAAMRERGGQERR